MKTLVDSRKNKLGKKDAVQLAGKASDLYVARGKKVIHIDLKKEKPGPAELAGLLLGPTGNLRAPTLIKGKSLVVGHEEELYRKIIGE